MSYAFTEFRWYLKPFFVNVCFSCFVFFFCAGGPVRRLRRPVRSGRRHRLRHRSGRRPDRLLEERPGSGRGLPHSGLPQEPRLLPRPRPQGGRGLITTAAAAATTTTTTTVTMATTSFCFSFSFRTERRDGPQLWRAAVQERAAGRLRGRVPRRRRSARRQPQLRRRRRRARLPQTQRAAGPRPRGNTPSKLVPSVIDFFKNSSLHISTLFHRLSHSGTFFHSISLVTC